MMTTMLRMTRAPVSDGSDNRERDAPPEKFNVFLDLFLNRGRGVVDCPTQLTLYDLDLSVVP